MAPEAELRVVDDGQAAAANSIWSPKGPHDPGISYGKREIIKRITATNDTGEYNNVRHPELTRLQSIVTQRPKEEDNNDDENGSTSDQEMEMHGARKHPGGQKGECTIGIEAAKGRWQSRNRVSRLLSVDLGHCRCSGDGFRVVAIRTRQHDALRLVDFGTL